MNNTRFDGYRFVHKGLRALMFQTASLVSTTDFADGADVGDIHDAASAVARLVDVLRRHGHHEDEFVMPLVRAASLSVHRALGDDHEHVEVLHRGLELRVARLPELHGRDRVAVSRDVTSTLHALIAEHLHHMEREEREANAALWARFSDDELIAGHGRLLAAIPQAERDAMTAIMLPALSKGERAAFERMARAS